MERAETERKIAEEFYQEQEVLLDKKLGKEVEICDPSTGIPYHDGIFQNRRMGGN